MNIIKDDAAQTSVEMILLMGGIIVVVVSFALLYNTYLKGLGNNLVNGTDLNNTITGINNLTAKLQ